MSFFKTKSFRIGALLVVVIAVVVLGFCRNGMAPARPQTWSWDLVRNGKVYSWTYHRWVEYPKPMEGDDWALAARLDGFHYLHGLPPIHWLGTIPLPPEGGKVGQAVAPTNRVPRLRAGHDN